MIMRIKYKILLVTLLSIIITGCSSAQTENSVDAAELDAMLSKIYKENEPGASVVIIKNNQTIFQNSYGMADVELSVPINDNMVYRIGSLTKQFTAASIMKLIEQGKLKLSDQIDNYLPDFPTRGQTITIENLLTHTSGIGNFENLEKSMMESTGKSLTVEQIIDFFKNQPSEFDPSSAYSYSNPGYILLGAIIEKISNVTFQEFVKTEIFEPLEMNNSYYGDATLIIPGRVKGYHRTEDGFVNAEHFNSAIPYAAGGLASSMDDLIKWNNALRSGEVVSLKSYQDMITPYTLLSGNDTEYGYGLEVLSTNNGKLIAHQGGIFGFQSFIGTLPNSELQIIILTNTDNPLIFPNVVADKIIDLVVQ